MVVCSSTIDLSMWAINLPVRAALAEGKSTLHAQAMVLLPYCALPASVASEISTNLPVFTS